MKDEICKVDGCDNPVKCKGMCNSHYHKFVRYGDPLFQDKRLIHRSGCSIEGCEDPYYSSDLCKKHYEKKLHHGVPDGYELSRYYSNTGICSVEGCSRPHSAHGYCSAHNKKIKKYGDPLSSDPKMHGLSNTPEFNVWRLIFDRCYNPKNKNYKNYGGRGITICDRWKKGFIYFIEDMGPRPSRGYQIDRTDNDGNYEPSNCKWVTQLQNARNKRTVKMSMKKARDVRRLHKTGKYTHHDLADKYKVSRKVIGNIINNRIWQEEKTCQI